MKEKYPETCPECGEPARIIYSDNVDKFEWYACSNPRCELADDTRDIQHKMFHIRMDDDDFAIGDSFWIGNWEFTVSEHRS